MTSKKNKIGNYGFSGGIPRKNFSKTAGMTSLPDLISVQSKSFNDLVQLDFLSDERQNIGLEKVLRDTFPISHADQVSLEFVSYELGTWACICGSWKGIEARYTVVCDSCQASSVTRLKKGMKCNSRSSAKLDYKKCTSCRARVTLQVFPTAVNSKYSGKTFSLPLKIRLKLVTYDTADNAKGSSPVVRDIKLQDVFFCSFPVMVDHYSTEDGSILLGSKGTFVVNGIDRVVVSQIHRAPGVLFVGNKKTRDFRGNPLPSARLIPARGVWLDFEFDSKDLLWIKVDKKRKLLASTFLQALGYSPEEAISNLYKVERIAYENGEFSRPVDQSLVGYKLAQGDMPKKREGLVEVGQSLDSRSISALVKAGVGKLFVSKDSLIGKWAAKKLFDNATGEIILEVGDVVSAEHVSRILEMGRADIFLIDSTEYHVVPSIAMCFGFDPVDNYAKAVAELYSRLRSGDLPGHDVMVKSIDDALHNPRFYDLSRVGRLRINRKLGIDSDLDLTVLSRQDILFTIKYLLGIKEKSLGVLDNSDHLANRCVRLVGELIQNQVYIAFSRIERIIRERFRLQELSQSTMPYDFINVKPLAAVLNSFFGTGQLSQFMDQTNPLAEMAHKRRLSALGPGGLQRESASLEVRDVQPSHYGRICTIETPDGANIGLISSLASYATVNSYGLLETPYRVVRDGKVTEEAVSLDAHQEMGKVIVQAKVLREHDGKIAVEKALARRDENFIIVDKEKVDYCDASPQQLVSVATALIPFLENNDANRALMGANMQRQAVPVVLAEPPIVATGMEFEVGCSSPAIIKAINPGVVKFVSSEKIVVEVDHDQKGESDWISHPIDVYDLSKFERSSHNTWVTQSPIVRVGDKVERETVISDGSSVVDGELALGKNVLVAFMPMDGYNFEDAIAISERMVSDDVFTSVHIEEFSVEARDTKLGAEEITKDIPNLSDKEVESLDEDGIVLVGTRVSPGNILVGKVTLKGDVQVSAEEKLLRAIFGEKSREVRDTSARVPPGICGTVVDVKVFSRSGIRKDARYKEYVDRAMKRVDQDLAIELEVIQGKLRKDIISVVDGASSGALKKISVSELEQMSIDSLLKLTLKSEKIKAIIEVYQNRLEILASIRAQKLSGLRKGDDLPSGVLKMVRVYIAMKRHISVGDKMVGRHGNKGVVSKIFKIEDMPYLEDGTPVDIVVNPLGCPGRMNLGQVLETMFGMACKKLGSDFSKNIQARSDEYCRKVLADFLGQETVDEIESVGGINEVVRIAKIFATRGFHVKTPVFDGANYADVQALLSLAGLPQDGKCKLFDGRTGLQLVQRVMVGYMYMMKLNHMVDDKIHARSVGPYSLITQQPLGGKAQGGGQRLGEMEVWALMAYGAAYSLQEMLTIKSDDLVGRAKAYDSLVHGDEVPAPGLPESFNVLVKELQSLGLQVDLFEADRGLIQ